MDELIESLKKNNILKTPRIIKAFRNTDRIHFVKKENRKYAYSDRPLSIGRGQTISQPLTVAFMLEELQPEKGNEVLDIGSGSGWTTALLSRLVGEEGSVIGLEIKHKLVEFGQENLNKLDIENAKIEQARENVLGIPDKKFDKILVSAAAKREPEELLDQLKEGGTLVIPIGGSIYKIDKTPNGETVREEYPGFAFVPLIH